MQKIIHQIWVGPYRMPKREAAWVEGMRNLHPDYEHHLWTDKNLPAIDVPHIKERVEWRMAQTDYALASDILRIYLVWKMGGIYMDVDTEPRQGLTGLDVGRLNGIFRHHYDQDLTLSNDFGGMEAGHPIGEFMLSTMVAPAYDFGPHWYGYTLRRYLGLPPDASHAMVRPALEALGMLYMPSGATDGGAVADDYWYRRFGNGALFSWSTENRAKFATGDYE